MPSVVVDDLNELDYTLNEIFRKIPESRRELHERLSKMLKEEVDKAIDESGLNDSRGKIKNWQEARIGSKGGYAAIRPLKGRGLVGPNSPGAITNYLEYGHRVRGSKAENQERQRMKELRRKEVQGRIRGRFTRKTTIVLDTRRRVPGYYFYTDAAFVAESKAIAEAEKFVNEFANMLEG